MFQSTPGGFPQGGGMQQFATAPGGPSGRDYTPSTAEEKAYYDALFQVADTQGQGQLFGQQAVMFLKASGLDQSTLKNIWAVSDSRGVHYLLREDFYVAVRLIAIAQAGMPATREKLLELGGAPVPYARFQGVPVPPPPMPSPKPQQQPGAVLSPGAGPVAGGGVDPYAMGPEDKKRYLVHFGPHDVNGDGFVEGSEAVALFSKSGLPQPVLGKVWELSDIDKDSRLSPHEFAVAMHLIVCISKKGLPVPPTTPASLLPTAAPAAPVVAPQQAPPPARPQGLDALSGLDNSQDAPLPSLSTTGPLPAPVVPPVVSKPPEPPKPVAPPVPTPLTCTAPPPRGGPAPSSTSSGDSVPPSLAQEGFRLAKAAVAGQSDMLHTDSGIAADLQDVVRKLQTEKISLTSTIESNATEARRLAETLTRATSDIAAMQAELSELRAKAVAMEEEVLKSQSSLDGMRGKRTELLSDIEKARAEVERLSKQKAALLEEIGGLNAESAGLKGAAAVLDNISSVHRAEADKARSETDILRKILGGLTGSQSTLVSEVQALTSKAEALRGQRDADKAALAQKQSELHAATSSREAASTERLGVLKGLSSEPLPASVMAATSLASPTLPHVAPAPSPVRAPPPLASPATAATPNGGLGLHHEPEPFAAAPSPTTAVAPPVAAPSPARSPAVAVTSPFDDHDDGWASPSIKQPPAPSPAQAGFSSGADAFSFPAASSSKGTGSADSGFGPDAFSPSATEAFKAADTGFGDFPDAPPANSPSIQDAFPPSDQAFGFGAPGSSSKPAPSPLANSSGGGGADPFSADPFGFPEDSFGSGNAAFPASTPSSFPASSGFDDFDAKF